jgi:ribosomal protein L24E
MSSNKKKIVVNGKEEEPIKKRKLPRDIDWQKIVKEKQEAESPSSGND